MKSNLWEKIGVDESIFTLVMGGEKLTDDEIISISITRGASGYTYGVQPAVLQFEIEGLHGLKKNAHCELKITPTVSKYMQGLTGVEADYIAPRYFGRIATQNSQDNGDGEISTTSFAASSYSALLKPTTRKYLVRDRTPVLSVIREILEHSSMPTRLITFPGSYTEGEWDITYIERPKEMTFSEIVSEYVDKQLIFICERRDGRMHVQSLALRERYLIDRAKSRYAPVRSHTLAPAVWVQNVEQRSENLILKQRLDNGNIEYRTWGSGTVEETNKEYPVENKEIDLTHVRRVSTTNDRVMRALNYQKNIPRVSIQTIKFDLLMLLSSENWYDRRVAGELLRLEHGDVIYLSGDWQQQIRAPMIAQQIKETITHDRWEMEITLAHPAPLLGLDETPAHPPRLWEQFSVEVWDAETKKWDEY